MVKNNFYALSLLFIFSSALSANDCIESCSQDNATECIESCMQAQLNEEGIECTDEQCTTECTECPMRKIEDAQAFAITFKIEKNDEGSWQTIANSVLDLIAKTECNTDTNSLICHVKELIEFARLRDLHGSIGLMAFETQDAGQEVDEENNVRSLDLEKILAGNNVTISFRVEKSSTPSEAWNVIVQLILNFITGCQECEAAEQAECATFQCLENIGAIVGQVEDIKASLSVEVIN